MNALHVRSAAVRHRRADQTRAGGRPVKAFLDELTDEEVASSINSTTEVVDRQLRGGDTRAEYRDLVGVREADRIMSSFGGDGTKADGRRQGRRVAAVLYQSA